MSRSSKDNVVRTRGYHGCMAMACRSGSRKTVPSALKLWSSNAEGHKGENEEVLDILREIDKATDGKGIRVYDRGGDRPAFSRYGRWDTKAIAGPSGLGQACVHKRRIAAAEEDANTNRSEASPRKDPGSR